MSLYDPLTPIGDPRILAEMSDEDLMQRIQVGDDLAFSELFRRYGRVTLSFARRILEDLHSAENCTQEAFLRIYREADKYEHPRPFKTWLYALLRNVLKNELRRRERKDAPVQSIEGPGGIDDSGEGPSPAVTAALATDDSARPDVQVEMNETQKQVMAALAELEPDDRECFYLHRFDGLKYKEIAAVLEIPVGTVRSRIHRVVQVLEEKLAGLL